MVDEELDFFDGLKRTRAGRFCMTFHYVTYVTDQH